MQDDVRDRTQGEFRGDFTRDTFYPHKHFTRVFMQQGRVQLEADWNEQAAILLHYVRTLTRDFAGDHWGPQEMVTSFAIAASGPNNFSIGAGHYYVRGLLCENEEEGVTYTTQPDYPLPEAQTIQHLLQNLPRSQQFLVYLDVWERHLSTIEDGLIREVALGGPDTATRAKTVWQVKLVKVTLPPGADLKQNYDQFLTVLQDALVDADKPTTGQLRAKAKEAPSDTSEPCLIDPEARYRGPENQLYRVEIHTGGRVGTATFKWSRENSTVVFPILSIADKVVSLAHLGRDSHFSLKPDDWIEIVDDDYVLQGRTEPLLQIDTIDYDMVQVTLKTAPTSTVGQDLTKHPLVRRWDHQAGNPQLGGLELAYGAALIVEGNPTTDSRWLMLEDGVQIQFPLPPSEQEHTYRTGDYWLIPARVATGDVEWPGPSDNPQALLSHGVQHHYAPLALITFTNNGTVSSGLTDLRRRIAQQWA